jgi:lipopolysaccharide/colanic/teichoic acid biosynthesis glycosyltransferase
MKLVEALDTGSSVVGLLDENPRLVGRSLAGVPVFGSPEHLDAMIDEFAVHGVRIDRVVVAGDSVMLAPVTLDGVRRACARRDIAFDFVGDFFNLPVGRAASSATAAMGVSVSCAAAVQGIVPARYFRWKRLLEMLLASLMILASMPLWLAGGALALLDVGAPVMFWQRRIGKAGHPFQLYKIRTLRFPVDRAGRFLSDQERVSWIGRLLRQTRIDELPQLLSVLIGDMALIGPRPLLPQDQPADPSVRLMVRPGITGWAQVNGGSLLEPDEKEVLDAWYVCHASPWLDLRILAMTTRSLIFGDRRCERALTEAHRQRQIPPEFAPVRFVTESSGRPQQDDHQTAVARSA